MTRYARPTGRCHWQRCLTTFDSNLLQVLILYELISSVGTKKSTYKVLFYKIWWVVQDDSLRSPYGSLPLATLSHCVRLEPAAGSHPLRVNIECWDEKKAPIRCFFTKFGGSCRMTRYTRPTGRCHWQRCLTAFDSNLLQVLILYELTSSVGTKKKHL